MQLTSTVSSSRVVSQAATASRVHLAYLDNLRIVLTSLVVLHHFAITCGAAGEFYGLEGTGVSVISMALLTLFTTVNQAFFMGLFFLISSYLTPRSYDQKGGVAFLTDRIKRLGIPLLFFAFIINPFLSYASEVSRGFQVSFWRLVSTRPGAAFSVGPLWFVEALVFFAFGYALFRQATRSTSTPETRVAQLKAPSNRAIALFAVALGLLTFIVRLVFPVGRWLEPLHFQLAQYPQYLALLCVGIVAYRNDWLTQWSDAQGRPWRWVILVLLPSYVVIGSAGGLLQGHLEPFFGGPYWQALAYALWEQFMGVAMIMSLLVWFRGRFNHQNVLARHLSDATYAVYVFHPIVLVPLATALRPVLLDGGFKFLLIAPVALALTFALGMGVKRLPLAREVL